MKSKKRSKKLSKKLSKKRSKKLSKKQILDGVKDEKKSEGLDIKVNVRDETILGGSIYELLVNTDNFVQSILDKFKCELIKNSKWPINENEYKYILKHRDGRVLQLDMLIADSGIGNETYLSLTSQKIKNEELYSKIEQLYSKIEQLEKKVVEQEGNFNLLIENKVLQLQAFNWLGYFGFPLERYNDYFENQKEVSAETIISAFEIMKKSKSLSSDDYKVSLKLYEIIKNMNDENLEKLIPFLIENNLGISKGGMANEKFKDRKFLENLKSMSGSLDRGFYEKIERVMAKIDKK